MEAYLTLSADQSAQAAEILAAPVVIPMHVDGWQHLTEDAGLIPDAFARHGLTDRLLIPAPGVAAAAVPVRD
jgi:L-ascorbate metabolism protein UlaG (beta-lactamase superfamily)